MTRMKSYTGELWQKRKRVALAIMFNIAILLLAWALSIGGVLQVTPQVNAATEKDDLPKSSSVIRIRYEAEPSNLNPWLHYTIYSHFIAGYLYESLLEQDPQSFEWRGRLAEHWQEQILAPAAGGKKLKFIFRLRKDARFSDGYPVSSEDVAFSLAAIRLPQLKSPLTSYFADIESVRTPDAHTVEVIYKRTYWMARKHVGELHILPRHVYDPANQLAQNPDAFAESLKKISAERLPVGSGPYTAAEWQRGVQLVLRRTDKVEAKNSNPPSSIVFRFIADHSAALQALKNGEIDFIPRMDAELFESEVRKADFNARFQTAAYYTEYFDFIAWNLQRPFFNDQRVRQALAYGALNKKEFLATVLNGRGMEVTGSQYYFGPAYNHDVPTYPYDLQKARNLLTQAGWIDRNGDGTRDRNGVEFKFQLSMRAGNKLARQRAVVIQQSLAQLQVKMDIRELELGAIAAAMGKRDFDACSLGWAVESESDPFQLWHSSQSGEDGSNLPGFASPEVDRLIEQSRATLPDNERRKIFYQLHTIIHDQQPYLFFYCRPNLAMYSSRLQGVRFYPVRPGFRITEWQKSGE